MPEGLHDREGPGFADLCALTFRRPAGLHLPEPACRRHPRDPDGGMVYFMETSFSFKNF